MGRAGAAGRGRGDRRPLPDLIEQDDGLRHHRRRGRLHRAACSACTACARRGARWLPRVRCGDRLLAARRPDAAGLGWVRDARPTRPLAGFSHGAAGIAWALLELAAATGEERFRAARPGRHRLRARPVLARGGQLARPARSSRRRTTSRRADALHDGLVPRRAGHRAGPPARRCRTSTTPASARRSRRRCATTLARRASGATTRSATATWATWSCCCRRRDARRPAVARRRDRLAAVILESIERDGWLCGDAAGRRVARPDDRAGRHRLRAAAAGRAGARAVRADPGRPASPRRRRRPDLNRLPAFRCPDCERALRRATWRTRPGRSSGARRPLPALAGLICAIEQPHWCAADDGGGCGEAAPG